MELQLTHSLTYTNSGKVPIADVAQSLLANETLIQYAAVFLERCYPDLKIERVEVSLRHLSHESPLSEIFGISLFAAFQKNLDKEVPHMIKQLTGYQVPHEYASIVTVIVFIIAFYGIERLAKRVLPHKKPEHTEKALNGLLTTTGVHFHMGTDALQACLNTFDAPQIQSISQAARDLFMPAKRESGAQITASGINIPREVIDEVPDDVTMLEEEETKEQATPYSNVTIHIRATDIDHNKSGWGGIPEGVCNYRIRMAVSPTIDLEGLYGKTTVQGDIILITRRQNDGTYKPVLFHLIALH